MAVNASQDDLIVLIFRYLKENGFHSAAEELLRHSPQEFVVGATGIAASLVEIYSFWLKHSENKYSSFNAKGSTPIKAASKHKPAKKPQKQKSVIPKEEKKDETTKSVTPAKTLKKQGNAVTAGDGDSDSDSSLDIDKWMKMVVQMSEVDVAKMDTINALDSSPAKPVKKRVRKSRAKPKNDTPVKESAQKCDVSEKAVTEEQAKSGPAEKSTPATLNGTQHLTSDEGTTTSSSQEAKKKEKKKAQTPVKKNAEAPVVQQKKKKKKDSSESEMGESTKENSTKEPVGNITNCSTESQNERLAVNTSVTAEEVKRKEKKARKKEKAPDSQISETLTKDKKSKKKKRDADQERISEPVADEKEARKQRTVDSAQVGEEASQQESPGQVDDKEEPRRDVETEHCMVTPNADVREKKAKTKKRESHPAEGTPQRVNDETKRKRKKDQANPGEEHIVEDKNTSVNVDEIAEPNTDVKKKGKRKLGLIATVPLFTLETPSPPSQKKKKKSQVVSATPTSA
ncbi:uncharacterized protein LOC144059707 [Vanacampus margaritifer]